MGEYMLFLTPLWYKSQEWREEVDHQRHLCRLLYRGMPHWETRRGWHQFVIGREGYGRCGVQEDEMQRRMVLRHHLHHL